MSAAICGDELKIPDIAPLIRATSAAGMIVDVNS
jgi:hypothetical protein